MNADTHFLMDARPRRLTRRGAETRDRILDAMVSCTVRSGFAVTTIEHVMQEAGLSRGSVLHQFPTRVCLAAETAKRCMFSVMEASTALASSIEDPFERFADYPRVMWETQSSPEGLAFTDILLTMRWDRELATALQSVAGQVEQDIHDAFVRMAAEAGFADTEAVVPHGWLLLANVRGLLMEYALNPNRPMILDAINLMKSNHRAFCDQLRAEARQTSHG
ncbi:MAG TPA: TetR/AcrR family transcriptional regulator [Chakrabartia sp.]|nr:TetR/AcrR family transcriptional regulator [Chakrabartia sp.]